MERLQKYLSECGVASRRKSEEMIKKGLVKVNGNVVTEMGTKIALSDIVEVEGSIIRRDQKEYYLLYKPDKCVSTTSDDKGRTSVIDLINTKTKIFPVGRLDYDTTGILLLTNDGELTNLLTHPSHDIEKVYSAKISGLLNVNELKELENGIELDGVKTKKARVKIKKVDKANNKTYVEITITEGKNHQVKNMFEAVGHKVLKLKRTRYAFLDLSGLSIGEYREITPKEVKILFSLFK